MTPRHSNIQQCRAGNLSHVFVSSPPHSPAEQLANPVAVVVASLLSTPDTKTLICTSCMNTANTSAPTDRPLSRMGVVTAPGQRCEVTLSGTVDDRVPSTSTVSHLPTRSPQSSFSPSVPREIQPTTPCSKHTSYREAHNHKLNSDLPKFKSMQCTSTFRILTQEMRNNRLNKCAVHAR